MTFCAVSRVDTFPMSDRTSSQERLKPLAVALLGALLVHTLLAALLLRAMPNRLPIPQLENTSIEIELRPVEPKRLPPAPRANPDRANASASLNATPANAGAHASPTASAVHAKALAPAAPVEKKLEAAPQLAAPGIEPAPRAPVVISRTLRDPLASLGPSTNSGKPNAGSWDGFGLGSQGPVHVPSPDEAATEEAARGGERVTAWVADQQAHTRASDPHDAYWRGIHDALAKEFSPPWSVLDAKPGASKVPQAIRQIVEQYERAANNYGATGSPLAPREGDDHRTMNQKLGTGELWGRDRGLSGSHADGPEAQLAMQAWTDKALSGDGPFHTQLTVHLLLTQLPDGDVEDVQVAASSGNELFDKLALHQAHEVGKGLFGPPPENHRRTLWAFIGDFRQVPPVPVFFCELDDFIPKECHYPLQKIIEASVRLEAIY